MNRMHFDLTCPRCGGELLEGEPTIHAPDHTSYLTRCDQVESGGNEGGPGAGETAPDLGQHLVGGAVMAHRTCSFDGCTKSVHARGWCGTHYARWSKHGDPGIVATLTPAPRSMDAIRARVIVGESGCWNWQGHISTSGYGRIGTDYVHRLAYQHTFGPIAKGLHIDHLCRNTRCCNPAHLEAVTPRENQRRGVGHGSETHCPQGHPYDDENTYRPARGGRMCRACKRDRDRRRHPRSQ